MSPISTQFLSRLTTLGDTQTIEVIVLSEPFEQQMSKVMQCAHKNGGTVVSQDKTLGFSTIRGLTKAGVMALAQLPEVQIIVENQRINLLT